MGLLITERDASWVTRLFQLISFTSNLEELSIYSTGKNESVFVDALLFKKSLKSLTKLTSFALGWGQLYDKFHLDMLPPSCHKLSLNSRGHMTAGMYGGKLSIDNGSSGTDFNISPWYNIYSWHFRNLTFLELHFSHYHVHVVGGTRKVLPEFTCEALQTMFISGHGIPSHFLRNVFKKNRLLKNVYLSTIDKNDLISLVDNCRDIRELVISKAYEPPLLSHRKAPSLFIKRALNLVARNCLKLEKIYVKIIPSRPLNAKVFKVFLENRHFPSFYIDNGVYRKRTQSEDVLLSSDTDSISSYFEKCRLDDCSLAREVDATDEWDDPRRAARNVFKFNPEKYSRS